MNYDVDKYITKLTVMELKTIINECLREWEDEKRAATYASLEKAYRNMWIKPPEKPAQPFVVVKIPEKPPNKNTPS